MTAARNPEIDCVLVWKFDRFARSTRHLLTALEEFNHLGVRFVSVQDQVDTDSPMGRAMFTIIGAMAELESSLISERVTAGMRAAEARGKHLGRPAIPKRIVTEIETLASSTDLSIRQIQAKIAGQVSRGIVGEITDRRRPPRCRNAGATERASVRRRQGRRVHRAHGRSRASWPRRPARGDRCHQMFLPLCWGLSAR
jgi:DNA invertase Pin-like site-specific DNA recombinase